MKMLNNREPMTLLTKTVAMPELWHDLGNRVPLLHSLMFTSQRYSFFKLIWTVPLWKRIALLTIAHMIYRVMIMTMEGFEIRPPSTFSWNFDKSSPALPQFTHHVMMCIMRFSTQIKWQSWYYQIRCISLHRLWWWTTKHQCNTFRTTRKNTKNSKIRTRKMAPQASTEHHSCAIVLFNWLF